jgi:sugar diacid utilization regulator
MSVNASRQVVEAASSTTDPDAQARRVNDGELGDGRATVAESAAKFGQSLDDGKLYAQYRRLSAEQAALRRLAALVAWGAEPLAVFEAVAEEMRRCVPAVTAGLWRFETGGEITVVAAAADPATLARWPVGTRTSVEGNTLAAMVQRTGRPAQIDSYEDLVGPLAVQVEDAGVRAAVGVPVIVDGRVWGLAAVGSVEPGSMMADTEARISAFAELIGTVVVAGCRDEQKRQVLDDASRRSSLIDALLEGRVHDDCSLAEVAGYLKLRKDGPFVVIAAKVHSDDVEPLTAIESKLQSVDVYSVWQLLPDWQVGIVHLKSEQQLDKVVALLSRAAADRVGISARFDDLRQTPQALHFAKMMLRGRPNSDSPIAVFDGTVFATAALAAPEVMVKSAGTVLACFADLPDDEREILFETFGVWQENDASVSAAAERLCCHPNTVRYRLRRIEKRTGRCLSRPRDVAELCLVLEVQRRLM